MNLETNSILKSSSQWGNNPRQEVEIDRNEFFLLYFFTKKKNIILHRIHETKLENMFEALLLNLESNFKFDYKINNETQM